MHILFAVVFWAGMPPCAAQGLLPAKGALVESELVRGVLWGLKLGEAASRLGLKSPPVSRALAPNWFLSRTFLTLWSAQAPSDDFELAEVSTDSWLALRRGRLFGYVRKVPLDDWDSYEIAARKRFGAPKKVHFAVEPPPGSKDQPSHMHIYRWGGRRSQFYIVKATGEDTRAQWQDANAQLTLRVRMRPEDPATTPLFIAAFDARSVVTLRHPSR